MSNWVSSFESCSNYSVTDANAASYGSNPGWSDCNTNGGGGYCDDDYWEPYPNYTTKKPSIKIKTVIESGTAFNLQVANSFGPPKRFPESRNGRKFPLDLINNSQNEL